MSEITLSKALTKKKVLAGKIAEIQLKIAEKNSINLLEYKNCEGKKWDIVDLMLDRNRMMNSLVDLKTKIENANVPIRKDIFQLAELKSTITFLRSIKTKSGTFLEECGYNSPPVEQVFTATYSDKDILQAINKINVEIEEIQDRINEFNHITKIEFTE